MRDKQEILRRIYLKENVTFKEYVTQCLKIHIMSTFYNNKEHALASDLLSMAALGLSDLHE
jgi:hypothetical protein